MLGNSLDRRVMVNSQMIKNTMIVAEYRAANTERERQVERLTMKLLNQFFTQLHCLFHVTYGGET